MTSPPMIRVLRFLCFSLPCVALVYLVGLPLNWTQQLFVSLCLVGSAILVHRITKSEAATIAMVALSILSSTRYIYYRITSTFGIGMDSGPQPSNIDMVFMVILLAAECYAYLIMILGYFQTIRPLNRMPAPLPGNTGEWPTVDIFVPTYNEPLSVVRYTVLSAINIDWPSDRVRVYILDDGHREEFRNFAAQVGCGYITRTTNAHAKAGNINHALEKTDGEFVTIFDCDHVPTRSFLQMTIGWFLRDARLAMLQTPHHFYSPDPFERNLKQFRAIPNEGELFYGLIQDGNDLWNATFFCGSCAVLRRSALEEIGGIAVETVTEDAHTSLRMQSHKWNTAYINIPQAAGLATESLSSHVGQRIRWARGMIQILRIDNPLTCKNLSIAQRLCYLNAMVHFLYAIPRLIFLTSPLLFLLLGHKNIRGYSLTIMAYALSHIVLSQLSNSRIQGKFRHSFWNEVYEAVLAPYILLPTMMALINPRLGKFNVTAKGGLVSTSFFDRKIAWPYIALLLLNILGLLAALPRFFYGNSTSTGTVAMNLVWTLYNITILGTACAVAFESEQKREHVRIPLEIPVDLQLQNSVSLRSESIDFSTGGAAVRVPKGFEIELGDSVKLRLSSNLIDQDLPAIVTGNQNGRLGLKFTSLSLPQEEALTKFLYSRADSWLNWNDRREHDRPLRSLLLITKLSFRGIWLGVSSLFMPNRKPERFTDEAIVLPASVSSSRAALVFLFGILLLGNSTSARAPHADEAKESGAVHSFHVNKDFRALGIRKPILLRGLQTQYTLTFSIPSSQVATAAILHLKYQLASGLEAQISQMFIIVNGAKVGAIRLVHTPLNSASAADIAIPSDFLLTDNSVTLELGGVCVTRCTDQEFMSTIQLDSSLELTGQRLRLKSGLSQLPAPFVYPQTQNAIVCFSLPADPGMQTLEAAGIMASWFTLNTRSNSIRFPVTLGRLPSEDTVLIAPASSLPRSFALGETNHPLVTLRPNPIDEYSTVLIITGANDQEVRAAAVALALGNIVILGQDAQIAAAIPTAARSWGKHWKSTNPQATFGDLFAPEQLQIHGFGEQAYPFQLPPDLYFGNRGGVPLQLNYRIENLSASIEPEFNITLNNVRVAKFHSANSEPIQHATIFLPLSALNPYNNQLRIAWKASGKFDSDIAPELQIQSNSSIDLQKIPHFVQMPKLERFSEAGFPFTRFADLSNSAFVIADPKSTDQLDLYLCLVSQLARQTGFPSTNLSVLPTVAASSSVAKDLIVLGDYADSSLADNLGPNFPVRFLNRTPSFSGSDNWWFRLRRDRWNVKGRTRQSMEDILSSDPKPDAVIAGFESAYHPGASVVAIFGNGISGFNALVEQFSGTTHDGAIYGSVSILYEGRFESLYLTRDEYQIGSLPWSEFLTSWILDHVYLVPILMIVCCALPAWWLLFWLNFRVHRRLVVQ